MDGSSSSSFGGEPEIFLSGWNMLFFLRRIGSGIFIAQCEYRFAIKIKLDLWEELRRRCWCTSHPEGWLVRRMDRWMEDGTGLEYKKAAESVYQSVSPLNHITVKCIYEGRVLH